MTTTRRNSPSSSTAVYYYQTGLVLLLMLQNERKPMTVPKAATRLGIPHETVVKILDRYVQSNWMSKDVVIKKSRRAPNTVPAKLPREGRYTFTADGLHKARAEVRTRRCAMFDSSANYYELRLDVLENPHDHQIIDRQGQSGAR